MTFSIESYTLKNGIRLVHRPNLSAVAHFGLIAQTGTRDELPGEHGMAHFLEHMFFKGTRKRSPYQVISRLEDVGGELNAYTTKEETALYSSFLKEDYRRAMELIQDIFLNSSFPEKELKRESEVILSEIQDYNDSPSELIFDRGEEILFPDHHIGRNILGTEESLGRFRREDLLAFCKDNYATDEIVLSFAGQVPFKDVLKAVRQYFGDIPPKTRTRIKEPPVAARKQKRVEKRDTCQKHVMLLGEAFPLADPRRLQLYLLNNILGGPGMNSRLNMALRERRGLSYSAESHYAPYSDTGALMIYFSSDPDRYQHSMQVCREEIRKLRTRPIAARTLDNAKKQLMGQLAISRENNEHLMLTTGKSFLVFNRIDSLENIRIQLESITATQLTDVANEILDPSRLNLLVFE